MVRVWTRFRFQSVGAVHVRFLALIPVNTYNEFHVRKTPFLMPLRLRRNDFSKNCNFPTERFADIIWLYRRIDYINLKFTTKKKLHSTRRDISRWHGLKKQKTTTIPRPIIIIPLADRRRGFSHISTNRSSTYFNYVRVTFFFFFF